MGHRDLMMMNYNLFKKMKELTEKQEQVLSEDNMEEFNSLFNQREQIRREITTNSRKYEIEIKNAPFTGNDQGVKDISMEISEVIRSIQEIDRKIEGLIISKKDLLSCDINSIKKGQSAIKRYGAGPKRATRFLDRKG